LKIDELSLSYLKSAQVRFKALFFYKDNKAYSDVVREAQELVELLLKAVLRAIGVEVPKVHDVSRTLERHRTWSGIPVLPYVCTVRKFRCNLSGLLRTALYSSL